MLSAEPGTKPTGELAAPRTVGTGRLSHLLGAALVVLLGALLVWVLFETWIQVILATPVEDDRGNLLPDGPDWPKTVKNALYLLLLALTLLKITVDRRWRDFRRPADIALVVLGVVLVLAGLFGDSPIRLIAEAGYVYLRGVIVFYAWRAADPSRKRVRTVLIVVGAIVGLNALIAIWQTLAGPTTYENLGWINMTWARINRAHALLDHPNHLGHLLALTMLGIFAYMASRPKVHWRWWLAFVLIAFALSATQSRESTLGFVAGVAVVCFLRRGKFAAGAICVTLVLGFAVAQLAVSPENRAELARRLAGVASAFDLPSGAESDDACVETRTDCGEDRDRIPEREVRVLYAQQGVELWLKRPVLGYGVGQFGGIVAYQHDPLWYQDPRFGPEGFRLYGSNEKQVDSFWLHLLVETGALGALAYLAWLFLLIAPIVRAVWRRGLAVHPFGWWAPAAMTFAVLVACLAPSLEDPLFPVQLFTILGLAWVWWQRGTLVSPGTSGSVTPERTEERE
ncbi:O-antigen ligase family protein [Phytohabitans kaempferiae]|uniref:O-antigen ligase family protein n=1 Tax=Phytohabitans kaempferiae TaxID=1620943 RepID=A0ABV6LZZ5_9ACTN